MPNLKPTRFSLIIVLLAGVSAFAQTQPQPTAGRHISEKGGFSIGIDRAPDDPWPILSTEGRVTATYIWNELDGRVGVILWTFPGRVPQPGDLKTVVDGERRSIKFMQAEISRDNAFSLGGYQGWQFSSFRPATGTFTDTNIIRRGRWFFEVYTQGPAANREKRKALLDTFQFLPTEPSDKLEK